MCKLVRYSSERIKILNQMVYTYEKLNKKEKKKREKQKVKKLA